MKGQKEAVVEAVKLILGSRFTPFQDKALDLLTYPELETIKNSVEAGIRSGAIAYGKDPTNQHEVRAYARSMVMNHLNKARELNGGNIAQRSGTPSKTSVPPKEAATHKGVDLAGLPEELADYVKTL